MADIMSRFINTKIVIYDDKRTYGRWNRPYYLSDEDAPYTSFVVNNDRAGRPDLISYEVYGSSDYWWVLAAFNSPKAILKWPKAGDLIKIPDKDIVVSST